MTSEDSGGSPSTLADALARACQGRSAAPFLLGEGDATDSTYGDVHRRSDQFAAGLLAAGVRAGDRIAIAAPNSPEWVVTWFAAAKIGAVLVTLNVAYREREFEYMLNQSATTMLVCVDEHRDFDFVEFLEGLRDRLPTVRHFVTLGRRTLEGGVGWSDLLVGGARRRADPASVGRRPARRSRSACCTRPGPPATRRARC